MPQNEIVLIGGGRHAISVISTITALNGIIVGYVDESEFLEQEFQIKRLGTDNEYLKNPLLHKSHFCVVGDNHRRETLQRKYTSFNLSFTNIIHPSAIIEARTNLGIGIFIGAFAYVNGLVKIGDGAIVNNHGNIEHGCEIGSFAHIGPNACLTGEAKVGERSFVGAASVLLPHIIMGTDVTCGAGSVVTKDIADGITVFGNPAKPHMQ